jgi:S-adenosylmethionine-dependent methyltransferase
MTVTIRNPFDEHQQAWREYRSSPWGRLRYAIVAHTLALSLDAGPLRIVDVGGGDGGDALPLAAAGHDVTVLDSSGEMLALAAGAGLRTRAGDLDTDLPTDNDVVLCHYVLQYRTELLADLKRLARMLRPGGVLSVIVPTAPGNVLAAAVRQGPRSAIDTLHAPMLRAVAFDREVRRFRIEEVTTALQEAGFSEPDMFGIRCVNDLITDEERKYDPEFYQDLLTLELELCATEPFRRIGMHTQFIARHLTAPATAPA